MFKRFRDIFAIAKKAVKDVVGKFIIRKTTETPTVAKTPEVPEVPKVPKAPKIPEIIEPTESEDKSEISEEALAKDTIEGLIDKIREMDETGYVPFSSHEWSINPEKAVNSNGAGIAKEDSGNAIIDLIRNVVADVGVVTVARSLEQYWDGILYQIERLEFAIYDAEYRKRSGGRAAYESAMLKLEGMLKIGSDEEVEGKYI